MAHPTDTQTPAYQQKQDSNTALPLKEKRKRPVISMTEMKRREGKARAAYETEKPLLREISTFLMPKNTDYNYQDSKGAKRHSGRLWNALGVQMIDEAANIVKNRVVPAESDWFRFVLSPEVAVDISDEEKRAYTEALNKHTDLVHKYLNRSNFHRAAYRMIREFLTYGYCAVIPRLQTKDGEMVVGKARSQTKGLQLKFDVWRNNTFYLCESLSGEDNGVFWRQKTKVSEWNMRHTGDMLIRGKGGSTEVEIIHASIPIAQSKWLYAIWIDGEKDFLRQTTSETPAVIVGKFPASAGETYPEGKGAQMLPEVQTAASLRFNILKTASIIASPMFLVAENADVPQFVAEPGARIHVGGAFDNVGNAVQPLGSSANVGAAFQAMQDAESKIREGVGVAPAPAEQDQVRTAFEWKLAQEKERRSGQATSEYFKDTVMLPLVRKVVEMLQKQVGVIPPDLQLDGETFDLNITGDKERAKQYDKIQSARAFMENTANIVPPELISEAVDMEKYMDMLAEALDVPELMKSPEERKQYREKMAQVIEQQQALQQGAPA